MHDTISDLQFVCTFPRGCFLSVKNFNCCATEIKKKEEDRKRENHLTNDTVICLIFRKFRIYLCTISVKRVATISYFMRVAKRTSAFLA